MRALVIGDIFGKPGRKALKELLPRLREEHRIDLVVVNGENAAGGRGLTAKTADELLESPVDVLTTGNHIWEHKDILPYLETHPILRPHNVDPSLAGRGGGIFAARDGSRVAVVSLQGMIYMDEKGERATNPFHAMDQLIPKLSKEADAIIVDFHAEATSEKRALGWYLDGRISALVGTHTHVQTADEEILPGGTAYISDIGMTGPHGSVIGLEKSVAIHRFLTGTKKGFKVAEDDVRLEAVLLDIAGKTGKAQTVTRMRERLHIVDG